MKLKYFNTIKALDKYSGNTEQFFTSLFVACLIITIFFAVMALPSELFWRGTIPMLLLMTLLFTYLENKKVEKDN